MARRRRRCSPWPLAAAFLWRSGCVFGHSSGEEARKIEWLRKNDGFASAKLAIERGAFGRMLRATAAITKGELLLRVPNKLMFTQDRVIKQFALPREVNRLLGSRGVRFGALAAHLLRELTRRRREGLPTDLVPPMTDAEAFEQRLDFGPFLDSLDLAPMRSLPLFWDNSSLNLLGHERSAECMSIRNTNSLVDLAYEKIVNNLFKHCNAGSEAWCVADLGENFTRDGFAQAVLYLTARVFAGPRKEDHSHLVPVIHIMNHAYPGHNVDWDWVDGNMQVVARTHISQGQELLISYGRRSNTDLLTIYGFTLSPEQEHEFGFRMVTEEVKRLLPDLNLDRVGTYIDLKSGIDVLSDATFPDEDLEGLWGFANATGKSASALRALLLLHLEEFRADATLSNSIGKLQKNRETDKHSSVWWRDSRGLVADSSSPATLGDQTSSNILRARMSQYLCILAYHEAIELLYDRIDIQEVLQISRPIVPHLRAMQLTTDDRVWPLSRGSTDADSERGTGL